MIKMANLKETRHQIDIKIAELRQQAHFALNKYDYHHKNDELQIVEQQMEILNQVADTYTRFLNEMQKFNQTLTAAKHLSGRFEQLVQSQSPSPTSQQQHQDDRQHETSTAPTALKCTKDKFKDTKPRKQHATKPEKQLFPPA